MNIFYISGHRQRYKDVSNFGCLTLTLLSDTYYQRNCGKILCLFRPKALWVMPTQQIAVALAESRPNDSKRLKILTINRGYGYSALSAKLP